MSELLAIDIRNLKKSYKKSFAKDDRPAVNSLNLKIQKNEVWALLGPNGAGKTTTLNCLTGMFYPDEGHIRIFGNDPMLPKARKYLGFQSEIFFTYPYLTAEKALAFYANLNNIPESTIPSRVQNLLKTVGLDQVAKQKTSSFSKGMLQRLGLAQSMIHDPEIVIWDEPSSGLDPEGRRLVIDLLQKMKAEGKTVLFSTHILNDTEKVCDHVAVLNRGKILLMDSLQNVLQNNPGKTLEDVYLECIRKDNNE